MNSNLKFKSLLAIFFVALLTFSCSTDDNDDLIINEESEFDGELLVTEANVGDKRNVSINATGTAKVKVTFVTTTNSMRRLYITQNVGGTGEEPFVFTSQAVDEKADGSLDLIGDNKKDFEFEINLPSPGLSNVDVVYKFWATTGRGDFRDVSKRNAIGDTDMGTITVTYGQGGNTGTGINAFQAIILAAPLADGSSNTFMSLYTEEIYKIIDGEESAALWDFGYFYGNTNKASLASAFNYPTDIVDIAQVVNDNNGDDPDFDAATLNKTYFQLSALTEADFTAISASADLNFVTQSTSERVTDLAVGDVVEFVDNYGHKGLIVVKEIQGTFGVGDFIRLDIKVQYN